MYYAKETGRNLDTTFTFTRFAIHVFFCLHNIEHGLTHHRRMNELIRQFYKGRKKRNIDLNAWITTHDKNRQFNLKFEYVKCS
jgi:hypothetical protein